MYHKRYIQIIILGVLINIGHVTFAQEVENELQTRTNINLSYKPLKKVKLSISPELRFDENYSLDKYVIEGEVTYKISDFLSVGTRYGFSGNIRDEKETEYLSRFAISATYEKGFKRFEPSLRIMYSNYADDDEADKTYLRYKVALKYDIPNCKINPYLAAQVFQDLNEGGVYKNRYALGANYKIFKKNYIGLSYKLDKYYTKDLNRYMPEISYIIKF